MSEPQPLEPLEPPESPGPPGPAPLFYEPGASWYWVLAGPATAVALALIQNSSGYGLDPWVPGVFLVLVSAFVAVQVKAARIHTSVVLTAQTLRQGTETIRVDDIVRVYPEPAKPAHRAEHPEKWQTARALGELSGVPRGRIGIGLRLTGGRNAQAWARGHRRLRAALVPLVPQRDFGPDAPDTPDTPDGPDGPGGWPR